MPSRRALLVWGIVAVLSIFPLQLLDRRLAATGTVRGSESAEVERRVREEFDSPFASTTLLVISGLSERTDVDSTRADVRAVVSPIAAHAAVTELLSPASSLDTLLLGARRTTAIVIVGIRRDYPHPIDSLRALSGAMLAALRRTHPSLRLRWTGEHAVVEDLRREGAREARTAELRALPVTLVIALWAFGSIIATIVAMLAAGLAIAVSLGVVGALSGLVEPSIFVRTIVPLLGFALTVDYSLYLRRCARVGAARTVAYRSVGAAALAVVIGLVGLVAAPTGELRSAAVGGMVAAALAGIAAISLTPWKPALHASPSTHSVRWEAWGTFVVRHPGAVLAACALPLLLLSREALRAQLVTPMGEWMPVGLESADALADLARAKRGGVAGSLRVLLDFPRDQDVLSADGWEGLQRASAAIRNLPGVADVHSMATIGTGSLLVAREVLPNRVRNGYVSRDGHATLLDVVPTANEGGSAAVALVGHLRSLDAAKISGVARSRLSVAGLPAYVLDYERAMRRTLPWIVTGTALATFAALLALLRAPLVALKAVVLNILVAAAAVGATVVVFQNGALAHALGHAPVSSIFPTVPALAFAVTFGMSMDYELFLIASVLDARRRGATDADAIVAGVVRSGPVIVRAAAIMIALFLAFATSALAPLAMVGFALAVAVALDATLVRLALAPALLRLAGRYNWWPGGMWRRPIGFRSMGGFP